MKDFERDNLKEMFSVRDFMNRKLCECESLMRRSRLLMLLYFWSPSRRKRCKEIHEDARNAALLYQSGIDVLNSHEGMVASKMR